jgi:outer membrane receptor protein involved in Fe transport
MRIGQRIVFICFFVYYYPLFAQQVIDNDPQSPTVTGTIVDKASRAPIEYANIAIRSTRDSSIVTGTISAKDGSFTIPLPRQGDYVVDIRFLGFKRKLIVLDVPSTPTSVNLGIISIESDPLQLKEVVVEGDRTPISYQIDKKVIDVGKMQTVVSGTAADVLQNVPSVTVDLEGNISLRGSTNFTVLIDGRPTVMTAQDALQQISATSLEKIEIITNPSAKYDPEGTSGIINIIMKKNRDTGVSGIINNNIGLDEKYGSDLLFQYKNNSFTAMFGADYNKRTFPGTSSSKNSFVSSAITNYLNSDGSNEGQRNGGGARGSLEFNVMDNAILNIGGRINQRNGLQHSQLHYTEWSSIDPLQQSYASVGDFKRKGTSYETNLTYTQRYNEQGHELTAEFNLGYDDDNESSVTKKMNGTVINEGERFDNSGPSREFEGKIDYTLPFSEESKFEAGYEGQAEISEENNNVFRFDSTMQNFIAQPEFDYLVKYRNSDHALYSIYSNKLYGLGIQGGIRTEYTFRSIFLNTENQRFAIDRWDFFPTIHTSYKFGDATQVMASYTRRIQRPHGWELEPYIIWTDVNNVRQGNPDLKPQYIDSYEAGVQTLIGEISFSADLYYRIVHNKIERIKSVYQPTVTLTSMDNIGHDYSLGSEYMVIADPWEFWNINLMANVYNYKVIGVLPDGAFTRTSFNWNTRLNNVLKVSGATQFQFNLNYNSPTVSTQGHVEDYFSVDMAAKQALFERLLTLTLQVRDVFGTAKMENTSRSTDFYSYNYMKRESPMVMLNLRWNFNNFERDREKEQNNDRNESNGDPTE